MNYFALVVAYVVAAALGGVAALVLADAATVGRTWRWSRRALLMWLIVGAVVGCVGYFVLTHVWVECDLRWFGNNVKECRVTWH